MTYTPAEQTLIDRYANLAWSIGEGYRVLADGGLTPEQAARLGEQEAELDALYPQLPQALRDEWSA